MLTDDFGRIHDYLRISLTDKCNLRCSYCIPYDLPAGFYANSVIMNTSEIDSIVSEFVTLGIKKVRITGGEPLVRMEAKPIIKAISRHPVELAITTNGILVDEFIGLFLEVGIKSVNLSLDTLNKEKFFNITRRDYFGKIISNLHILLENKFSLKVNVVLIKGVNDDEILDFIQWTKNLPLHIRFIEFMPFTGNQWENEKVISHKQVVQIAQTKYRFSKLSDEKNSTSKNYRVDGFTGTFGVISTISEPFCESCNRIRLTADGKLKNCLFSSQETDILTPLRQGTDIKPIIVQALKSKKEKQGGQSDFLQGKANSGNNENRSMLSIGG